MTKPHEETWTVSGTSSSDSYDRAVRLEVPGRQYLFGDIDTGTGSDPCFDEESKPEDEARARLAAQAPAMARLLLAMQWSAKGDGLYERPICPVCGGAKDAPQKGAAGHAPDCELVAVLRAAGVMP